MHRFLYSSLRTWKNSPRRKPLLLQGARQVGKTYLLNQFGEQEFRHTASFNFETTPALVDLFQESIDAKHLLLTLSAYAGQKIDQNCLVFFDEIQLAPRALSSLKYFCEQTPEIPVVAAGSLLGVSVGKQSSFPVGKVSFQNLYPMNFPEFLLALDENELLQLLENHPMDLAISKVIHQKLIDLFKLYSYLGGMPEVVAHFVASRDFQEAREIQKEIVTAYERDFSKHKTSSEAIRVAEVWRSIPTQLSRENKKFKYSTVSKGGRSTQFESAIEWLAMAGIVHPAYQTRAPKLPLAGYADQSRFKIYLGDTGLLGALLGLSSRAIVEGNRLFDEYKGAFTENIVATELKSLDLGNLHYWLSGSQAEVDFLLECADAIIPFEVKSGLGRQGKSLQIYRKKYKPRAAMRASLRNFTHDGDFWNIPLYAVSTFCTPEKLRCLLKTKSQ